MKTRRRRRAAFSATENEAKTAPTIDAAQASRLGALAAGASICGYRVVRLLRRDAHSHTYRAHRDVPPGAGDDATVVDLRVFEPSAPRDRVSGIVELHGAVESEHLQRMLDIGTDRRGRVVLALERTETTLATVLGARGMLPAGEAVTVLAPLSQALVAVHGAGYACGSLTASQVGFTPDGKPLIIDVDGASRVARAEDEWRRAGVETEEGLTREQRQDYRDLGALSDRVLHGVGGMAARDVDYGRVPMVEGFRSGRTGGSLGEWIGRAVDGETHEFVQALEYRIYGLAEPQPVDIKPQTSVSTEVTTASSRPGSAGRRATRRVRRSTRRNSVDSLMARFSWLVPASVLNLVEPVARMLLERRLSTRGRGDELADEREAAGDRPVTPRPARRRAVLFAGVVSIILVAGGLLLVPETDGTEAAQSSASPETASAAAPPDSASGAPEPDPAVDTVIAGDDPVAAVVALLGERARCVLTRSQECLSRVDEAGSAAFAADAHAIETDDEIVLGATIAPEEIQLVQRHGDAAILTVVPAETDTGDSTAERQPVIVLAIATTAGWRLRDVFESE